MRSTIEQASPSVRPSTPEIGPRGGRATGLTIATVVAAVLLVLAGTIAVVEQRRIADRDDRIANLGAQLSDTAGSSRAAIDRLNERIARLEARHTSDHARISTLEAQLSAVAGAPLADGRHFGYVTAAVAGDRSRIFVDVALFLTDEAGKTAADAHGDEFVNGYYVVNDNPAVRTLPVSPDASVWIVGPNTNVEPTIRVQLQTWVDAVTSGKNLNPMSYIHDGYWFDVVDGQVVRLTEQWVP